MVGNKLDMNINDVEKVLNEKYRDYVRTVRHISWDEDNEVYMSTDEIHKMYSYDEIIKSCLSGPDTLQSVDGISIQGGCINFIEFKNGKFERKNLLGKISEGKHYLQEVLLERTYFSVEGIKTRFVLVYNKEKLIRNNPSLDKLMECVAEKGNIPVNRWKFGRSLTHTWHFFDEAVSLGETEFQERIDEYVGK